MCIGGSSKIARTAEAVLRPLHAGLFGSGSAGLGIADRFLPDAESGSQRWKVGIGAWAGIAVD
jgi:hypothetical protein